ncbi:MAG: DUF1565 domain-containing protein [Nostocaceae cyanobacterium]|nr:DUF1565 domain-containing protein [Nostocaceae cyanobacterium]
MTHQIPFRQPKNVRIGFVQLPFLRAGLTALLLLSGGSALLPSGVSATPPQVISQTPASGTVIYVNSTTGSDASGAGAAEATPYKTITYALTKAQPNTTIQLASATYSADTGETFPLVIKQGVTLRGDESAKGQATLITGGGLYVSPTFARQNVTIRAFDCTITGVTVSNTNKSGTGIWVESTNPAIANSTFTNNKREGIFVSGTGNPKIENNVFVQNEANGISVTKASQGEIRNNLFQNTGFGLAIGGTSTPLLEGNQIVQNKDGIVISDSAKPVLRKNVIQNNTRDGIVVITNAIPDLGTTGNQGGNLITNNGRFDLDNATRSKLVAIGNDIDPKKISGQVDLVVVKVDAPPSNGQTAFQDVPAGFWAKSYIEALAAKSVIAGFPDGTFKPDEPVTRAQFAAIITKAFTPAPKQAARDFSDVKSNFWAYAAIQTAYRGGFIAGYPDRSFKPQDQILRVQSLVSLANGLGLTNDKPNALSVYTDAAAIPKYATESIAAATARQLVVNYPNLSQLNPNRPATRAEVAAFVYQALVNGGQAPAIASPYVVKVP